MLAVARARAQSQAAALSLTDTGSFSVSESTCYRLLKRHGLVKPAEVVGFAAEKEYRRKTERPNQMWATDGAYLKVANWEFRFAPLVSERLRAKRRGNAGRSWYLDETYVKVSGRWCYLYRAIDRDGNLLDSMLSEHRDRQAARRFLRRLLDASPRRPLRLTTDNHPAYNKAVRWIVGRKVLHRQNQYLNNHIEQDHRPLKQRYYPMLGFGRFDSASRFCTAFDELRHYLRVRNPRGERVSASRSRQIFSSRWSTLMTELVT